MKHATTLLTLATLVLLAAAVAPARTLTDEQIMTALEARMGHKLKKHDVCLTRPKSFPNVVVVGFFAYDRGCDVEGVYLEEKYGELLPMTPAALASAGWSTASASERQRLARAWIDEVVMLYHTVLREAPKDFQRKGAPRFEAPAVAAGPTGLDYTCWVQDPHGMRPITSYRRLRFHFGPDGRIMETKVVDSFEASVH